MGLTSFLGSMMVTVVQVGDWIEDVWDLTQIVVIDRHVGLPLSKWRGYGVESFSV